MAADATVLATLAWTLLAALLGAFSTLVLTQAHQRRQGHRRVVAIRAAIHDAVLQPAPPGNPRTVAHYFIDLLGQLDELLLERGRRYALRAQIGNARIRLEEALQDWAAAVDGGHDLVKEAARALLQILPSR